MYYRSLLSAIITLCIAQPVHASPTNTIPPLVLAESFDEQFDVSRYWVSEKYDGARAWWNGKHFISRSGNIYHAPDWFIVNLPDVTLDGELWIGRNKFQQLMKTIRDQSPDHTAWQEVRFMVFDAPQATGHFSQRQQYLTDLLSEFPDAWVQLVPQQRVSTKAALQSMLEEITNAGAEGLMLQREELHYLAGRHYGLLKLKTTDDAEATVIAHRQGKGKYKNVLGSILVETSDGVRFRIGSGFTDKERANPPPIGSTVTFRYQGKTNSGKPRFARYLRMRPVE